ncbi:hypothetical protein GGR56DRAFT_168320 [Xylariaceae sp. FL0804]|nr:hypothetical protein GGR56DRAFT_168320 [Xylariaceae sp. FL0804]
MNEEHPSKTEQRAVLERSWTQLLGFLNFDAAHGDDGHHARGILDGDFVRPFWDEYRRDYLEPLLLRRRRQLLRQHQHQHHHRHHHHHHHKSSRKSKNSSSGDTDADTTSTMIEHVACGDLRLHCVRRDAFARRSPYAAERLPGGNGKRGWTAADHAARFVVRVLRRSWARGGEWTCGRFDPRDPDCDLEFFQVWASHCFLQMEWEAANEIFDVDFDGCGGGGGVDGLTAADGLAGVAMLS